MPKLYRPQSMEAVEVVWDDAQYDGEYDGQPGSYDPRLARLTNLGYFVKMTRDSVVLCSCVQVSNGTTRWFVTIPRKLVVEIRPFGGAAHGTTQEG